MFRRIRHRFCRLYACQWLFGIIYVLVIALVVRHNRQQSVQFSKILILKDWRATANKAPSERTDNDGRVKDWEGVKRTPGENDVGYHIIEKMEDAQSDINVTEGEIANIDANSRINRGNVNVHLWRGLCCPKINSLRQYPLFPTLPKERLFRHTINSGPSGTWYGQRIMGFVYPPITGNYTFHLIAHVFAELWLGKEQNATDVELIAKVAIENNKHSSAKSVSHTSRKIYLEREGKYFFDLLHVMNGGMMSRDHVNVTWLVPSGHAFTEISAKFLSPLLQDDPSFFNHRELSERSDMLRASPSVIDSEINDADAGEGDEDYEGIEIPRKQKLSKKFISYFGEDFNIENHYDSMTFDQLPEVSQEILSIFPSCPYEPKYAQKRTFKRFEGIWKTHFSSVFPDDGTKEFICIGNRLKRDCHGNSLITADEVLEIVRTFTKTIQEKYPK